MSPRSSPPPFGVYSPAVTFFHEDESIDFASKARHVQRLLDGGVSGLVIHGSNGEATHLSHDERAEIIRSAKEVVRQRKETAVIIAGCSANSVRETLVYIEEARTAGADFALVLPPSYWAASMSKQAIKSFYTTVASKSVLPVLIYNFPKVAAGINVDSDIAIELASTSPNLERFQRVSLQVFAGKADFLLPGLVAGSSGVISALANLTPALHVEVIRLYKTGQLQEAQLLQRELSRADGALQKLMISVVKAAVQKWFGYGSARPRSPLPCVDVSSFSDGVTVSLQRVVDLERSLISGQRRLSASKL